MGMLVGFKCRVGHDPNVFRARGPFPLPPPTEGGQGDDVVPGIAEAWGHALRHKVPVLLARGADLSDGLRPSELENMQHQLLRQTPPREERHDQDGQLMCARGAKSDDLITNG